MNVKLSDLVNYIDTDKKQLWLMASLTREGIASKTAEEEALNLFGVLVALIYDLLKRMGRDMETIAPIIMHHAKNLKTYAEALEAALDKYCSDEPGPTLLPTAFLEILDNRLVYFNWINRLTGGKIAEWTPHDMKPDAGPVPGMPPVTSLTIAVTAMYLRTIGVRLHEKAAKAFCSGVLFKGNDEDQTT
jgi:hypothetical protein